MDRYKAYLLPGVAALLVLTYYAWRWTANGDAVESTPTPAVRKSAEPKALAKPAKPKPEPSAVAPAPTPSAGEAPKE